MGMAPPAETFRENLSGYAIELVASDNAVKTPGILFWDGEQAHVEPSIELELPTDSGFKRTVYKPPAVDPVIWRALHLPKSTAHYGSTEQLFQGLCELIQRFTDLPDKTTRLLTCFVLASWFSDCTKMPICLSIVGPRWGRASQLFQLLSCLYRRALCLAECTAASLSSLPMGLRPSLFVDRYATGRHMDKFLRAFNARGALVPGNGRFFNLNCWQVICGDQFFTDVMHFGNVIDLFVSPARKPLPVLSQPVQEQVANEYQSKLLTYRIKHHHQVTMSDFDVPEFRSPAREIAQSLGACLPDSYDLQAQVRELLKDRNQEAELEFSTDLNAVLIEVLVSYSCDLEKSSVRVGEITSAVNAILCRNGELMDIEPRTIGYRLKALGFATERLDASGRGITLDLATRRRINVLSRDDAIDTGELTCRNSGSHSLIENAEDEKLSKSIRKQALNEPPIYKPESS